MANQVVMGAMTKCSEGMAPGKLVILPLNMTDAKSVAAATVMDFVPMMNIMPFGLCKSMANPMVSAATSAAMGVLTPMPCIPLVVAPWSPGSAKVTISNKKALLNSDTCKCTWAGTIEITQAGQSAVEVT